ncbi:dystrotelin [Vicugna pacos]|uniref:Dystrotelin n=1 Tax=Vicugna pacos TaxID=30538 RepID=A0ABM5D7A1_VICPA
MDPDKQGALNSIENSIYRTAFKLRAVQTLCQLDLIDSSLIQHVLLRRSLCEARESALSVQQLFQALQELFQRVRLEKPGPVHPRASELTLSLLKATYDSTGTGFLNLAPAAAALIALSGDSPLTKYRAKLCRTLFQLYAESHKGSHDSGARMTQRVLRNLLTDLQQIPTVVGESRALCSVESATRSCFQGVLSSAIKEEKFLSWLQSEPPILLWLPTCYRQSATEMATHPVRCRICRSFPITGLRYRCLKCLNFDICQVCFVSGLHSKSHQKSHPVIANCIQMSAKDGTKLLPRTLRNNPLQGRCRRKEAVRRQWVLDQVNPKDMAHHAQARLSIQCNSSETPIRVSPTGPVETAATEAFRQTSQRVPRAQQTYDSSRQRQTIVSIRNELWRTHESINALHRDRKLLKKQLNLYKDKLQAVYTCQEEKSCRLETKIHELTTSQDSLWTKLQLMEQELQAMLQPLQPSSSSCQNMVAKGDRGKGEKKFWKGGDSSQTKDATGGNPEQEALPKSLAIDGSHQSQARAGDALSNSESPEVVLQPRSTQSTRARSQAQKTVKELLSFLPSSQERLLQDTPQTAPTEMNSPVLAPAERKETVSIQKAKDNVEEEELQELLSKLMDAFILEMPSGPQSSAHTDLYCGAERVCRAFSALIDQITLPNLK